MLRGGVMLNDNKIISIEIIHKELDLIQSCITRMDNNSFILKGWLISLLVVILMVLPGKTNLIVPISVIFILTVSFWYLDAIYLRSEKLYRKLYEWVVHERLKNNDEELYILNPHRFDDEVESTLEVMLSTTLKWFYGMPIILICFLILYHLL